MFGKDALPLDKFMRSLQLSDVVDHDLKIMSPEQKKFLQAYADGVNDYVENQAFALPMEFKLIGIGFEKWTIKDSVMVFKLLSFLMTTHWQITTLRTGIARRFGKELAEKLIPFKERDSFLEHVTILRNEPSKLQSGAPDSKSTNTEPVPTKITPPNQPPVKPPEVKGAGTRGFAPKGSNVWAVHGNYTASGKPMLANDPHLTHQMPSEMYMACLKYPNGPTVIGATLSGLPVHALGRNEHVAWGFTMSFTENVELYELKLDESKKMYYHDGKWKNLKVGFEIIKVKDGQDISYPVCRTHHGPILDYPLVPEVGTLFG